MTLRTRLGFVLAAVAAVSLSGSLTARQQLPERPRPARPDFDIRELRAPAPGSVRARSRASASAPMGAAPRSRLDPHTGALRVLDAAGLGGRSDERAHAALRNRLGQAADRLGLDDDVSGVADGRCATTSAGPPGCVTSRSRRPSTASLCLAARSPSTSPQSGEIVRVTSSAAHGAGRRLSAPRSPPRRPRSSRRSTSSRTCSLRPPSRRGPTGSMKRPHGSRAAASLREVTASLVWFAMDGAPAAGLACRARARRPAAVLRCARRRRERRAAPAPQSRARRERHRPRRAVGSHSRRSTRAGPIRCPAAAGACPPPINHELRNLTAPFRDSETVLVGHRPAVRQQRPRLPRLRHDRRRARHLRRNALVVRLPLQLRRLGRDGALLRAELRPRLLLRSRLRRSRRQLPGQTTSGAGGARRRSHCRR